MLLLLVLVMRANAGECDNYEELNYKVQKYGAEIESVEFGDSSEELQNRLDSRYDRCKQEQMYELEKNHVEQSEDAED